MPEFFTTPQGRRIAYNRTPGRGPGVVFLGGFRSDMEGTKAVYLEEKLQAQGRAFLRFDYSGHGQSSEDFLNGSIGDWAQDAIEVIQNLTFGPQVLVGSSMGGWISLLVAKALPERVAGFVGIAAAPDFTEDSMWASFDEAERAKLMAEGRLDLPSDYGDPYPITRRLIEDGRQQLVLRDPLALACPVRLLQGSSDEAVPVSVALRMEAHIAAEDLRLTIVKGADHRFSTPDCLALIESSIQDVLTRA